MSGLGGMNMPSSSPVFSGSLLPSPALSALSPSLSAAAAFSSSPHFSLNNKRIIGTGTSAGSSTGSGTAMLSPPNSTASSGAASSAKHKPAAMEYAFHSPSPAANINSATAATGPLLHLNSSGNLNPLNLPPLTSLTSLSSLAGLHNPPPLTATTGAPQTNKYPPFQINPQTNTAPGAGGAARPPGAGGSDAGKKKRKADGSDSSSDSDSDSHPSGDDEASDGEDSGPVEYDATGKPIKRKKLVGKGGSSCHQCKSRRNFAALTYCTSNLDKKNKRCRKKFCGHCLKKFYKENVALIPDKNAWKCPSCRKICCCAACRRRKQKDANGGTNAPPRSHSNSGGGGGGGSGSTSFQRPGGGGGSGGDAASQKKLMDQHRSNLANLPQVPAAAFPPLSVSLSAAGGILPVGAIPPPKGGVPIVSSGPGAGAAAAAGYETINLIKHDSTTAAAAAAAAGAGGDDYRPKKKQNSGKRPTDDDGSGDDDAGGGGGGGGGGAGGGDTPECHSNAYIAAVRNQVSKHIQLMANNKQPTDFEVLYNYYQSSKMKKKIDSLLTARDSTQKEKVESIQSLLKHAFKKQSSNNNATAAAAAD